MLGLLEDKRNEFKIKLTQILEKEIISFLNTESGNIFILIDDNGNINVVTGNVYWKLNISYKLEINTFI